MPDEKKPESEQQSATLKFCPICGDTMHQEDYLDKKWWFCDDPECGYIEQATQ